MPYTLYYTEDLSVYRQSNNSHKLKTARFWGNPSSALILSGACQNTSKLVSAVSSHLDKMMNRRSVTLLIGLILWQPLHVYQNDVHRDPKKMDRQTDAAKMLWYMRVFFWQHEKRVSRINELDQGRGSHYAGCVRII
jgi:hypothetical protein